MRRYIQTILPADAAIIEGSVQSPNYALHSVRVPARATIDDEGRLGHPQFTWLDLWPEAWGAYLSSLTTEECGTVLGE